MYAYIYIYICIHAYAYIYIYIYIYNIYGPFYRFQSYMQVYRYSALACKVSIKMVFVYLGGSLYRFSPYMLLTTSFRYVPLLIQAALPGPAVYISPFFSLRVRLSGWLPAPVQPVHVADIPRAHNIDKC